MASNERKMYRLSVDVEHQCISEDSKVRIYLSEVRGEAKETAFEKIMIIILQLFYSGTIAHAVGTWAIAAAYEQRGYKAYGGEYILIAMVFAVSYYFIHKFFEGYRRNQ